MLILLEPSLCQALGRGVLALGEPGELDVKMHLF